MANAATSPLVAVVARAVRALGLRAVWAVGWITLLAPTEGLNAQQALQDTTGQNTTGQNTTGQETTRIDPMRDNNVDLTGDELAADPFENSWRFSSARPDSVPFTLGTRL